MMKKFYLIAAAAAAVLAAGCAKNEVIQNQGPGDAVSFGVYVPKTVTKAGATGTITTDGTGGTTSLQSTSVGFGVFATYSNGGSYSETIGPNFMYNQKVTWTAPVADPPTPGKWGYTPVKYWPNETVDDSNGAHGPAAADKLSFFAYAPYVDDPDGDTWGITDLTDNNVGSDPMVTYAVATDPSQAVDLIWAVAPSAGFSYTDVHGTTVSVTGGMPLINLTKPNITTTIPFHFRHATARLGFKIVGAIDQIAAGGELAPETKITVEQVRVVDLPVYTNGVLNLNNTATGANKPNWVTRTGESTTLVISGDNLNVKIKDASYPGTAFDAIEGVEPTPAKNVFVNDNTFFTLLPKDGPITARIEITYYVTTKDGNLASGYSRVQNIIYKDINFASGFQAGKAYTIKIILGLTSVKLEAEVEPWDVLSVTDVDLPINHNNSFDLASTASVTLSAGTGETDAVWSAADGEVSIDGTIKKGDDDFDNSTNIITLDTTNKKIKFNAGATAGTYVIPVKAAGDATHNPVTKTITVTVTGS